MRSHSLVVTVLASVLFGAAARAEPAPGSESGAVAVVEGLHAALIDAMRSSAEPDVVARIGRLAPVVETAFDFETIGRVILGGTWRALEPAQRSLFVDTFGQLSTATYAARFKGYKGESFVTLSAESQKQQYRLVKTTLTKSDGGQVALNYLVRPTADGWRIVNVIADGVSDLSLKRADYGTLVKTKGFDALLEKLASQIASYRNGATAP
jgi:phospholipid transport system substrate-binding protein